MNRIKRLLMRPFFIKLFNWEYWSFGTVYSVVYPVWILLAIRARSFFFFSASNPTMENGGFLCESKKDIHSIMPADLYPRTMHFEQGADPGEVTSKLEENAFRYPLIGKPDTGGRGRGVKQLVNRRQLEDYVKAAPVDFHIQEFIPFKNEVGIFYYRYPGQDTGRISGIVRKEFLSVTGNGNATLRQLIMKEERSLLQMRSLENIYGGYLDTVIAAGEEKVLVPYGNHARGARFLDESSLADEKLGRMINDICTRIDGFYFGRLDIRYNTWEELKEGKNFSIIEVNGAGSEPTHIYDPRHSIFFAWKEIVRHWFILNKISIMNHRNGHKYLTVSEGLAMFRQDKMHSEKLKLMPE